MASIVRDVRPGEVIRIGSVTVQVGEKSGRSSRLFVDSGPDGPEIRHEEKDVPRKASPAR